MNLELFSHSKYKNSARPGDDVALVLPDRVYAVFDGATDPTGAKYHGESGGRIAARAAARCVDALAQDGQIAHLEAQDIFQAISDAVRIEAERYGAAHPPSTTAAIVVDAGDAFRVLTLGDSGVRVNGQHVHIHHKLIDAVSASARIAIFRHLAQQMEGCDELEMQTRSVIYNGLDYAVDKAILSRAEADAIIAAAGRATGHAGAPDIARFLATGIRRQPRFANAEQGVLRFASLNGSAVIMNGVNDVRVARGEARTFEIFSDGYFSMPEGTTVADWEHEFARAEEADFHKTGSHPSVKGSTASEFADDRTILSIALQ